MTPATAGYFVTGGTLPTGSRSYVERAADREILEALNAGEFCYVLTARQMGKSSLMVRTAAKLREQGVAVAVLDLTAIGQNVTPAQWYDGLAQRLGRQLRIEDEIDDYWLDKEGLGPCQRFFAALRDVALPRQKNRLIVFVDEIDSVRSLPFKTDEFFAAIRETYNRRTEDPELIRLTFCLLGVATPSDLVRDPRTTPFNIGRRIALSDFTPGEAVPLIEGLMHGHDGVDDMSRGQARAVLERILYWTGGQPFLTQRFCRAIKDRNDAGELTGKKLRDRRAVDTLCHELFLSHRSRESDDNLALVRNRLLNADVDRAALLDVYRRVHAGRRVDDDETSPVINTLRLAGIVRARDGRLVMRNRIYREVFDQAWIQMNLPEPEKIRQRQAFRSGLRRGLVAGLVLLVGMLVLAVFAWKRLQEIAILRASGTLGAAYDNMARYRDVSEMLREVEMQGTQIRSPGTNRFWIERPDRLRIETTLSIASEELELVLIRNGTNVWEYSPRANTYRHRIVTNTLAETFREFSAQVDDFAGRTAGMFQDTMYRFLVTPKPGTMLQREGASFIAFERDSKRGYNVFGWGRRTEAPNGQVTNAPVSIWVDPLRGFVRRIRTDYTGVLTETRIPGRPGSIPMQRLVVDVQHLEPQINPPAFPPETFRFNPPPGARKVSDISELSGPGRRPGGRFGRGPGPAQRDGIDARPNIPPRQPATERRLIDITPYYNVALTESWHSHAEGYNLATLTSGRQRIGGIEFDIRGVIQLAGRADPGLAAVFPHRVADIPIRQRCRRLHFLQGTAWTAPAGTHLGSYVIRYEDGQERIVPVVYGYDVRDWIGPMSAEETARGLRPAWTGTTPAGQPVLLFLQVWWNPRPDVEIAAVDFVSAMANPAPFLVAVTLEE